MRSDSSESIEDLVARWRRETRLGELERVLWFVVGAAVMSGLCLWVTT